MPRPGYWRDPDFQQKLVTLICQDRNFLRECGYLLDADDFKPRKQGEPTENWIIASTALEFYEKYREPISGMLRTEILDYCRTANTGDKQKQRLLESVQEIRSAEHLVAIEAMAEKVISYKKEKRKAESIQEMMELWERGQLTDEKWMEHCYQAIESFGKFGYEAADYFPNLEDRIVRRMIERKFKYPYLMIDPLDELIRAIGRGHLGVWFGYLKKGKSLALIHTALSYILQGLSVLYFTLEDPKSETENRFDGAITNLPTKRLVDMPDKVRIRFARFNRLVRSRFKIIDGTDGGMTVARVEEIWERERNRGLTADAIIIDYDDEIVPPRKQKERRFEFADIYRALRQLAARKQVIVWTAAQTDRKSENKKIITSGAAAEDISKMRKCMLALGIGTGDWGERSRYIHVAAHKFDRMHVGCNIMGDQDRGIFYDRSETMKMLDMEKEKQEAEQEVAE